MNDWEWIIMQQLTRICSQKQWLKSITNFQKENAHFIKSEHSVSDRPTYNYRARNQALRLISRCMIWCSHRYLRADRSCVMTLQTRASSITFFSFTFSSTKSCRFVPKQVIRGKKDIKMSPPGLTSYQDSRLILDFANFCLRHKNKWNDRKW